MTNIEFAILDFIRANLTSAFMDSIMKFITFFGNGGWFWIVTALVLMVIPKTRKIGFTMAIALLLDGLICNLTLKPLIARTRPYEIKEGIELIISTPHDFSFPSGHSGISFAGAVAIFCHNKKWGGFALAFATLIALSRLYLYVHFPTDIIGGAFVGTACALIGFYIIKKAYKKGSV